MGHGYAERLTDESSIDVRGCGEVVGWSLVWAWGVVMEVGRWAGEMRADDGKGSNGRRNAGATHRSVVDRRWGLWRGGGMVVGMGLGCGDGGRPLKWGGAR